MTDTTLLECPECGEQTFSYVIRQIHFGSAHETDSGDRFTETHSNGEIVGDDIDENGVYCTTCDVLYDMDELLAVMENTDN